MTKETIRIPNGYVKFKETRNLNNINKIIDEESKKGYNVKWRSDIRIHNTGNIKRNINVYELYKKKKRSK